MTMARPLQLTSITWTMQTWEMTPSPKLMLRLALMRATRHGSIAIETIHTKSSLPAFMDHCTPPTLLFSPALLKNGTPLPRPQFIVKGTRSPFLQTLLISARRCIVNPSMSSSSCSQKWVQQVVWMVRGALSSRVASSKNK